MFCKRRCFSQSLDSLGLLCIEHNDFAFLSIYVFHTVFPFVSVSSAVLLIFQETLTCFLNLKATGPDIQSSAMPQVFKIITEPKPPVKISTCFGPPNHNLNQKNKKNYRTSSVKLLQIMNLNNP